MIPPQQLSMQTVLGKKKKEFCIKTVAMKDTDRI